MPTNTYSTDRPNKQSGKGSKNSDRKADKVSDTKSFNISEQPLRTVNIYHGYLQTIFYTIDGVKWCKKVPTGGIRVLNVSPHCTASAYELAKNYDGFIPNPEDLKPRLYVEDYSPKPTTIAAKAKAVEKPKPIIRKFDPEVEAAREAKNKKA